MEKNRLYSLDFLRGLDIFYLTAAGLLLRACDSVWGFSPFWKAQLTHYHWDGFSSYDLILPLFLFMAGAAVPLAIGKRLDAKGRPTAALWKHLAGRFALLWTLGLIIQGNVLSFDPPKMRLFVNVLQTMGVLLVVTNLWYLVRSWKVRLIIPLGCFAVYMGLMYGFGDMTREGNALMRLAAHNEANGWPRYLTVFLATQLIHAGVFGPLGAAVTMLIRSDRPEAEKLGIMFAAGAVGIAAGLAAHLLGDPFVKGVWSFSETTFMLGFCLVMMGGSYWILDVLKWRRGTWLFVLYGQCSLVAYVLHIRSMRPALRAIGEIFCQGLPVLFGKTYQELFIAVVMVVALTWILVLWRRMKAGCR